MKKLFIFLTALMMLIMPSAVMATGVIHVANPLVGSTTLDTITVYVNWVSDSSGSVPTATIPVSIFTTTKGWYLYCVERSNSNIAVTLTDTYGLDLLWGLGITNASSPDELFIATSGKSYPPVYTDLIVTITSAADSISGTLIFTFKSH